MSSNIGKLVPNKPQPLRPNAPICETTDLCRLNTVSHTSNNIKTNTMMANSIKIPGQAPGEQVDLVSMISKVMSDVDRLSMENDSLKRRLIEVESRNDQRSIQQQQQQRQQQQQNEDILQQIQRLLPLVYTIPTQQQQIQQIQQIQQSLQSSQQQQREQIQVLVSREGNMSNNVVQLQQQVSELFNGYNTQQSINNNFGTRIQDLERGTRMR